MRTQSILAFVVGGLVIARVLAACGGGDDTSGPDTSDAGNDGSLISDGSPPSGDAAIGDAGPPSCLVDASGPYLADAIELSLASDFGCALRQDGSVVCWGTNDRDEVGFPDAGNPVFHASTIPFPAAAGRVTHISVGSSWGCAIAANNNVWCWGDNSAGDIGQPTDFIDGGLFPVPVIIKESSGAPIAARALRSSYDNTCAITIDGRLLCWGYNGDQEVNLDAGYVGGPAVVAGPPLTFPASAATFSSSAGYGGVFTCAISSAAINCWGQDFNSALAAPAGNYNGAVGEALTDSGATFPMRQMSNGSSHSCVIDSAGKVWCWGTNEYGQLGPNGPPPGPSAGTSVPVLLPLPEAGAAISVGTGYSNTCVVAENGTPYCAGEGLQLGNGFDAGPYSTALQAVVGVDGGGVLGPVARIASGGSPMCATLVSSCGPSGPGPVFCWGLNGLGELGNPAPGALSYVPVPVLAP